MKNVEQLTENFTGRVSTPQDPDWDDARQAYNLDVDQRPAAVVRPANAQDVIAAVRFAEAEGLGIAPQSTGHNARSLAVADDAILIRTGELDSVEIDAGAKRARVGAGTVWGPVVSGAAEHGLASLHGSSGTVGITGYSLMGGIGWYARSRGLASNSVTAIEVVTADGTERRADADSDPDLFWALRGGGGSYGVVTALEFDLFACEKVYAGMSLHPWERSLDLLRAWHELVSDAPDELTTSFRILQLPDIPDMPDFLRGGKFAVVDGAFEGPSEEGEKLADVLKSVGEPVAHTWDTVPASALPLMHMDPPEPVPGVSDHRLIKELDDATIEKLVEVSGPGSESPLTSVELRHLGGALDPARAPEGAGALRGLEGEFSLFMVGSVMSPELGEAIRAYMPTITGAVEGQLSDTPRYLNFAEERSSFGDGFDAETVERLRSVKAEYDPSGVIRGSHDLGG